AITFLSLHVICLPGLALLWDSGLVAKINQEFIFALCQFLGSNRTFRADFPKSLLKLFHLPTKFKHLLRPILSNLVGSNPTHGLLVLDKLGNASAYLRPQI